MYGFCNVWICVCMGFVMCGYVYVWVLQREGILTIVWVVLVICVIVFTVFLYCFV